jgi:hypothetical protein
MASVILRSVRAAICKNFVLLQTDSVEFIRALLTDRGTAYKFSTLRKG